MDSYCEHFYLYKPGEYLQNVTSENTNLRTKPLCNTAPQHLAAKVAYTDPQTLKHERHSFQQPSRLKQRETEVGVV